MVDAGAVRADEDAADEPAAVRILHEGRVDRGVGAACNGRHERPMHDAVERALGERDADQDDGERDGHRSHRSRSGQDSDDQAGRGGRDGADTSAGPDALADEHARDERAERDVRACCVQAVRQ